MKDNNKVKPKKNIKKLTKFLIITFCVIKVLVIVLLLGFILNRLIYGLQRYLYQRPGEIFFGGGVAKIGTFPLIIFLIWFILCWEDNMEKKYFSKSYRRICEEIFIEMDPGIEKKFNKFVYILIPISFCLIWLGFNEFLALGDKYIAFSSISPFPNRKEYSYSEVRALESYSYSGTVRSKRYTLVFPDGKETRSDLGSGFISSNFNVIKKIREKQQLLGLKELTIEKYSSTERPRMGSRILSLVIQGLSYFFLFWMLGRMFKPKKTENN